MKKNFTLALVLFLCIYAKAQTPPDSLWSFKTIPVPPTTGHASPNGTCDSLNIYDANNWPAYYYRYTGGGFVFGTNTLRVVPHKRILQNANYFDVSATNYNYVSGGLVYFAVANSEIPGDLFKVIKIGLYNDEGGLPGKRVDSTVITLGQIRQDVLQGKLTEFKFSSPVSIRNLQKFYIAVDHRAFHWTPGNRDSVAIVATSNDATANTAFQFFDDDTGRGWKPVNQYWKDAAGDPLDVSLFIFPYVSEAPDGCGVLPVSMFNFGGIIKNSQAYLNWSTAVESNNKGFYVERSKDGKDFSSIGFVNGKGNTSQITNYSYTDASLKDINVTKTYYRLKQVDLDGKFAYSNVIALSLDNLANNSKWKLYPNPVKEKATVEVNLEAASKVKAELISRDGKVLLNTDKGVLNEGTQQFYINTQSIAKGSYILRVTIGDKTYSQLLVKE